jgi:hypothetical protein
MRPSDVITNVRDRKRVHSETSISSQSACKCCPETQA